MPHSKQAKKRLRQSLKQRLTNRMHLSGMRSFQKRLLTAVRDGNKEQATALLPSTLKRIDKAAKHRVIHPNAADRKKSQMMKAVRSMG